MSELDVGGLAEIRSACEIRAIVALPSDVVLALIARLEAAEAAVARVRVLLVDGPDSWTPFESRDTGLTFLEESVLDFTTDLRAALAGVDDVGGGA